MIVLVVHAAYTAPADKARTIPIRYFFIYISLRLNYENCDCKGLSVLK